ncbi:MAG: RNA polymerase sigma factor [Myxococcaceae bacterium]
MHTPARALAAPQFPTLAELYRAHAPDVARWARRLGGPLIDVEDVVQEVFLVVHRQLPSFRAEAAITTWLFRITANVASHRRRKDRLRRWLRGTAEETGPELASDEPDATSRIEQAQLSRRLYRVLDGMSEKYRTVLILFELEEHSGEQIAELMNARIGTVWVWLHRARADFLERMKALEEKEGA